MIVVRSNNLVSSMHSTVQNIIQAVFTLGREPVVRASSVPVAQRRQATVRRSVKGPVVAVMLSNWPLDRVVAEIVSLSLLHDKAVNDHDTATLDAIELEMAKLRSLCEQHDLKDPTFTKRVWEKVAVEGEKYKTPVVNSEFLDVVHGGEMPGTLGAELSEELKLALHQLAAQNTIAETTTPPVTESAEDMVNRAMEELANGPKSTI